MVGGQSARVVLTGQCSGIPFWQVPDRPAHASGPSWLGFFWHVSYGLYSRYRYGEPSDHGVRTVRVCAELVLVAHNGRFEVWAINRSGARVWGLYWTLLAYIELICDPLTQTLTLVAWDRILVSDWEVLVHLHPFWSFEALGDTSGKRHWLVTLEGCHLLDGSGVVSVNLSVNIVEEPRDWLWGIRAHLAGAAKATLVELRYWVSSCPLGSKNKSCLDKGASKILNSTSTWIRGERQITDTTW